MKKVLLLFTILFVSVITTACINNLAVQELNNKAAAYMDKGDTETAICRLKSSLDLDEEIYQTHYNLAVAYNNVGDFQGAVNEAKRTLEINPEFYDAYYTMAVAKEALAYQIIDKQPDENGNIPDLTNEEISMFNSSAQDTIDTYNEYIVKKVDAEETEQVNNKIAELNAKIKEFTQRLESAPQAQNEQPLESQPDESQPEDIQPPQNEQPLEQ